MPTNSYFQCVKFLQVVKISHCLICPNVVVYCVMRWFDHYVNDSAIISLIIVIDIPKIFQISKKVVLSRTYCSVTVYLNR